MVQGGQFPIIPGQDVPYSARILKLGSSIFHPRHPNHLAILLAPTLHLNFFAFKR
jgi:hypothetical protein